MTLMRAASDVGGTFTDLVLFGVDEAGRPMIRTAKTPTTPPSFDKGVVNVFEQADVAFEDVTSHVHGTTVVINAITERKGAKVGLITTEGFRDSLAIARGNRPDFFNLDYKKPEPFVPRYLRREIPGRLAYTGEERDPLDLTELESIVDDFRNDGVEAVAVCLLHSWANASHEVAVVDELRRLWPEVLVTASSAITQEWREYERTSTAVLSAYVQPVAARYLHNVDSLLAERSLGGPTSVMQSNGGVGSVESIAATPIVMVESGPASGFFGAANLGRMINEPNVLALDIGGTTAKCSLIENGNVRVMTDYWLERTQMSAGYPAMVPVVDLIEIGNGGGSIAWVDDFAKLHVGPQSAGADPGPVSYGAGGSDATTTDANLWLGRIGKEDFCGGNITPDMEATEQALARIGEPLGLSVDEAARGIVRIANDNMVNALKLISLNRGYDPRDFALVAFGGGGPMHAIALATELGVKRVVIPQAAAVFSAWGMISSDRRQDRFVTALADVTTDSLPELTSAVDKAGAAAMADLVADGAAADDVTVQRFGRLRYAGQEHTTEVLIEDQDLTLSGLDGLLERFGDVYEAEYTYRLDAAVEMVGVHAIATAPNGAPVIAPESPASADPTTAQRGHRSIDFAADGRHESAIYDAEALRPGMSFTGPASVEGSGTSVLIHPGWSVDVDGYGNLRIGQEETS